MIFFSQEALLMVVSWHKVWGAVRRHKSLAIGASCFLAVAIVLASLLFLSMKTLVWGDVAPFDQKTLAVSYFGEGREVWVTLYEQKPDAAPELSHCQFNATVMVDLGTDAPFNLTFYGYQSNTSRWCEATQTFLVPAAGVPRTFSVVILAAAYPVSYDVYCPENSSHQGIEVVFPFFTFVPGIWSIVVHRRSKKWRGKSKPAPHPPGAKDVNSGVL